MSSLATGVVGNNLTSCYYHNNFSGDNLNTFRIAVFQRRDLNLLAWTGDSTPTLTFERVGCAYPPSLGEGTNLAASWLNDYSGRLFYVDKFGNLFAWEYKLENYKLTGFNHGLVSAPESIVDPTSSLAAVSVGEPGNVTQYVFWQADNGDLYYGCFSPDGTFNKELIRTGLKKGTITATVFGDVPVVWTPKDNLGEVLYSYTISDGAVPSHYDIPSTLVDPTYGKFTTHTVTRNGQLRVGFVYQKDNVNPGPRKLVYLRRDEAGREWTKDESFPGPQLPGGANMASFGAPSKDLLILYEANLDHHVYYKKSSDGGESWSEQFQLPEA